MTFINELQLMSLAPTGTSASRARFRSVEVRWDLLLPPPGLLTDCASCPLSFGSGLPHPSTFPVSQMSFTFPYVNKTVVMSTPDQPSDDKLTVVPGAEQPLYVPLSLAMQYRYAYLSQLFPNHLAFNQL